MVTRHHLFRHPIKRHEVTMAGKNSSKNKEQKTVIKYVAHLRPLSCEEKEELKARILFAIYQSATMKNINN